MARCTAPWPNGHRPQDVVIAPTSQTKPGCSTGPQRLIWFQWKYWEVSESPPIFFFYSPFYLLTRKVLIWKKRLASVGPRPHKPQGLLKSWRSRSHRRLSSAEWRSQCHPNRYGACENRNCKGSKLSCSALRGAVTKGEWIWRHFSDDAKRPSGHVQSPRCSSWILNWLPFSWAFATSRVQDQAGASVCQWGKATEPILY